MMLARSGAFRRALGRRAAPVALRRPMSLLGTIFGIGEFEGARNQALGGATGKQHAFEIALLEYVGMNAHPKYMLQKVLDDAPQFLMGHVLVGASECLAPLAHQDSLDAKARLETAVEIANTAADVSPAEKMHVLALDGMVHGRFREAAVIYETILTQNHSDLLALRCCFDLYLLLGDHHNMLTSITRRLPSWSPNETGYSHLLSMQAYALQAAGRLDAAEALAEKAMSMNGNDRWAFYTMLHVFEARANANHGASYANQYKDAFDNGGPLERHLYFQWALFLLELGRYDRIDKMLEVNIFPRLRDGRLHSYRTLCDATQLFWRLRFAGRDTSELAQQLRDGWVAISSNDKAEGDHFHSNLPPLAKLCRHSVLALTKESIPASDSLDVVEPVVSLPELQNQLHAVPIQFSYPPPSDYINNVFSSVYQAFEHYAEERYEEAAQLLLRVRGDLAVLGGNAVERDLINLLLIECAASSADLGLAKLLLNERLCDRPQSAQSWSKFSRVFESMGDASGVRDAQSMSYVLGLGQGGHGTA